MNSICAAALLAVVSTGAVAQSNVTIYGRIDVSGDYLKTESTATRASQRLITESSDASLLGFRGSEDLGGGSRAFFKLEMGYQLDTGAQTSATSFFNRESYVGLGDAKLGSIEVGEQWSTAIFTSAKTDPFTRFGIGSFIYLLQGTRGFGITYNNAVAYLTPDLNGLTGKVLVSAGEGAVTGKSYNAALEYSKGPLYLGLNYDQLKAVATTVGLTGAPVWSRTLALGGTYDFSVVKLHGWYQTNKIENLQNITGYMAGITVPFGTSDVRAAYSHRSANNANASLIGVGYDYFFSKRTLVYAVVAKMDNSGTSALQMGPAAREEASVGLPGAGQGIRGLQVGMRHSF